MPSTHALGNTLPMCSGCTVATKKTQQALPTSTLTEVPVTVVTHTQSHQRDIADPFTVTLNFKTNFVYSLLTC